MRAVGQPYSLLSADEVGCLHRNAMRILAEMGMQVENQRLLQDLADFGMPVDFDDQRVRFPTPLVERFLAEAEKHDWDQVEGWVRGSAGVYHGRFHDPQTGALQEWDEDALAYYFGLARAQSRMSGAQMLGCRLPVPAPLESLYERFYCWKYGAEEGSSIYLDESCPHLYDLYQARASELGKPLEEVFRATVYLVPALRLGQHEASQVEYFRQRGLRVGIGSMLAMGANAPATLAGALALNIAEQLALRLVDWVWFGRSRLHLGGSISVMDMRTMIYPYGRPEMALANLMIAQMARYYGASYHGHAGLSDAKLPSVEAGYQKALTAIPTLMACGALHMDAGLLSIDEVCSPVQLILDNEFLGALQHIAREFRVDDDAVGIETILAAGPGGQYLDKEHTVQYFRSEHWQPKIWSREMLHPWLQGSQQLDADRAREIALQFRRDGDWRQPQITPEFEREMLRIIGLAERALC